LQLADCGENRLKDRVVRIDDPEVVDSLQLDHDMAVIETPVSSRTIRISSPATTSGLRLEAWASCG
jgi:hypothetical protein